LDVIAGLAGDFGLREDLVDVRVEDYVVDARAGAHEAVPVGLDVEEGVVDYYCCVAVAVADVAPAVVVEFLDVVHVQPPVSGLVEEFDGGYDVGVAFVPVGEVLDCG
jgi:hypothetical protein